MNNKLVCGVGIFEKGKYKCYENGKMTKVYNTWKNMLERCYSSKFQVKQPTYIGCTVTAEWLYFQTFAEWYTINYYEIPNTGIELDKDILVQGNKVYALQTCIFIPKPLNTLLNDSKATRGLYPQGVYFHKHAKKFMVRVRFNGNLIHLGYFETAEEASEVYKTAKHRIIMDTLRQYIDTIPPDVYLKLYIALSNYEIV